MLYAQRKPTPAKTHATCCRRLLRSVLQGAVVALRGAANTEAAAADGRLDTGLARLARALDPSFNGGRLEALELLTVALQVCSRLLLSAEQVLHVVCLFCGYASEKLLNAGGARAARRSEAGVCLAWLAAVEGLLSALAVVVAACQPLAWSPHLLPCRPVPWQTTWRGLAVWLCLPPSLRRNAAAASVHNRGGHRACRHPLVFCWGASSLQAASMLAAAAQAEATAGGEQMADADGAEEMDTSDPLAYELSAALRAIASLLQLDASGPSAEAMVAAVQRRVAELLAQLPAGFFEPLLPPGSLNDAQVRSRVWLGWSSWEGAVMLQLPAGLLECLLPPGSLNDAQARLRLVLGCCRALRAVVALPPSTACFALGCCCMVLGVHSGHSQRSESRRQHAVTGTVLCCTMQWQQGITMLPLQPAKMGATLRFEHTLRHAVLRHTCRASRSWPS